MSTPPADAEEERFLAGDATRRPDTQEERWMLAAGQLLREHEARTDAELQRHPAKLQRARLARVTARLRRPPVLLAGASLAAGIAAFFCILFLRADPMSGAVVSALPASSARDSAASPMLRFEVRVPDPARWAGVLISRLIALGVRCDLDSAPGEAIFVDFAVPEHPAAALAALLQEAHVPLTSGRLVRLVIQHAKP